MSHLTPPVGPADHAQGPEDAPVTLVEYGDFQCPYCRQAYPIVQALQARMAGRLRFVFRHFPIGDMHPHAEHAAQAAEAADAQGQFWVMHDALYVHQQDGPHALDDAHLARYAREVGGDATAVTQAIATGAYAARVRADFMGGVRSGVNGTPTFFINGLRFDGDWTDVDALAQALDDAAALPA